MEHAVDDKGIKMLLSALIRLNQEVKRDSADRCISVLLASHQEGHEWRI